MVFSRPIWEKKGNFDNPWTSYYAVSTPTSCYTIGGLQFRTEGKLCWDFFNSAYLSRVCCVITSEQALTTFFLVFPKWFSNLHRNKFFSFMSARQFRKEGILKLCSVRIGLVCSLCIQSQLQATNIQKWISLDITGSSFCEWQFWGRIHKMAVVPRWKYYSQCAVWISVQAVPTWAVIHLYQIN